MARYTRKRRSYRRSRKDHGFGHQAKLMFTSKVRRTALIVGMVASPILMATTKLGNDAGQWIASQAQNLFNKG
jgi:hypothetical protein